MPLTPVDLVPRQLLSQAQQLPEYSAQLLQRSLAARPCTSQQLRPRNAFGAHQIKTLVEQVV